MLLLLENRRNYLERVCHIYRIAICSNLGEDRGLGLIVNFGAALIICELDDIIMLTGRIQYWRELYDNKPDESGDPDEVSLSKYN